LRTDQQSYALIEKHLILTGQPKPSFLTIV
jgi:hypothetical protein